MAELDLVDAGAGDLELRLDGAALATLRTGAGIPAVDTPKPHIHPLRTPSGVPVTGFAPEDHPWHHGLQFAMPRVDASNLWGGGTYFGPDEGYRVVEDQGVIEHLAWGDADSAVDGAGIAIDERLRWCGHDGEPLLGEERRWTFALANADGATALVIDIETELASLTGAAVSLATPAQRGRPDGGYGGLFLRLGEGFTAEQIVGEEGGLEESGGVSRTMIVHGRTGDGDAVTLGLAFLDGPTPGGRHWLHRFDPFSAIGWAVAYEHGLDVPAEGTLRFEHRLAIADGHVPAAAIRALL